MSHLKTFMSITDVSIANDIIKILNENNIVFKVKDTAKDFDPSLSNDTSKDSILIMAKEEEFTKISQLLEDKMPFNINDFDPQHPLFSFSISELKDVVKNYDEWHPIDVKLAKYLLKQQNITVENEEIISNQTLKKEQADKPEKSDFVTIAIGYAFAIISGFVGIGIAFFLLTSKKRLSNGEKIYMYSKTTRLHGIFILLLGIFFIVYFIFIRKSHV
ncbi:hypothetical protein [Flavobacterium sp. NRK F7]|uniref:hypothetical protein n=1 Tax=Flavobacterium sp. NRK F7 TaxID=2954930 RepID=UPI0020910BEA|nr:hypothetical protein [Flavobacterium sp. NRK F7]MCO6163332.1 hypothetical protein [Flavobacterium sp. NRK F7]